MPNKSNAKQGYQESPNPVFKGYSSPNYTAVPDELLDKQLPDLSGAELKVLLYICRRTFGFKKDKDNISLGQLSTGIRKSGGEILDRGTGLAKDSVIRALKSLEDKNIVIKTKRSSKKKGYEATTYSLNVLPMTPLSENRTRGSTKIGQGLVRKSDIQKTVIQKTVNNTVNGYENGKRDNGIKKLKDLDQPKEKTDYVARHIVDELGDQRSKGFYNLIASKVPEGIIRQTLSEIKVDGARNPRKLFTYRMKEYALERTRQDLKQNKKALLKRCSYKT